MAGHVYTPRELSAAVNEVYDPQPPSACTGNCNQGRMCDCVPDVLPEPNPHVDDWMPCTWQENLRFWLTIAAATAAGVALIWWRLA